MSRFLSKSCVVFSSFLMVESGLSFLPLLSCSCSQNLKILLPKESHYVLNISPSGNGHIIIPNFSYNGKLSNLKKFTIQNSFARGLSTIKSSPIDIDTNKKKFSILLEVENSFEGLMQGSFSFYDKGKKIDCEEQTFEIEIRTEVSIQAPKLSLDSSVILDKSLEYLSFELQDFKSIGIYDYSLLTASLSFSDETVRFEASIVSDKENEFNVMIKIFNTSEPKTFTGHMEFLYFIDGQQKSVFTTKEFNINVLPERSILQPKYDDQNIFIEAQQGRFVLEGFHFNQIDSSVSITPNINFTSTAFPGNYEVNIINWNAYYKTFDIEILFSNSTYTEGAIEFDIDFTSERHIEYNIEKYRFTFFVPISKTNLSIVENPDPEVGGSILTDIITEEVTYDFNLLLIPEDITVIDISGCFTLFGSKNCYLMFEGAKVHTIELGCFESYTGLIGTLALPASLQVIEDLAFAFTNFTTLDLSAYDTSLPLWATGTPHNLFRGMPINGSVIVSKKIGKFSWMNQLMAMDLPDTWQYIEV